MAWLQTITYGYVNGLVLERMNWHEVGRHYLKKMVVDGKDEVRLRR